MTEPVGSDETIGIVIVGCGIIGENHADAIAHFNGVAIAALVDAVPASATALADRVEASGRTRPQEFASLTDALALAAVDLVVICTPSGLHVALAEEALAADKHVLIEKPLDVSLPRARRIAALADAAEKRGLVSSVVSQHRFDPATTVVRTALVGDEFGRVTSGIASVPWWREQSYYDQASWRGTWELDGGGAAMNQGVHTIDLLLWFLGVPVDVSARSEILAHDRIEVEDTIAATVRFANGALGVIHATTAAYPGLPARVQVHGSRGSAIIDDDRLEYFATAATGGDNRAAELVPPEQLRGGPRVAESFVLGHVRQYEDVLQAIREKRAPIVRVADAMLALAVVRAMYLSSTLERTVTLDEVLSGGLDDVEIRTGGVS
ncbi:MAG: bplA [Glaciihabitans sp.]|nr:bplA [Glaciihabitans sp.]